MKAYIKLEGDVTAEDSFYLKELANLIEKECDLSLEIEKTESQPGVKDSGLAIAIAIASLAGRSYSSNFNLCCAILQRLLLRGGQNQSKFCLLLT